MRKEVALFILLLGFVAAVAPWSPLGEPNLHPPPLLLLPGTVVGCIGAYLIGFRVRPPTPRGPLLALVVMAALLLLLAAGFVL